jgi:hypothetical protein
MLLSPDGRYLLIAAGDKSQAFDLQLQKPVEMGGKLKSFISQTRIMTFVGPDEFLVATTNMASNGLLTAQVLSFPGGSMLQETHVIPNDIEGATKGHLLITRPIQNHAAGILDYEQGKLIGVSKFPAMDLYDHFSAAEAGTGALSLGTIGDPKPTRILLPVGKLPELQDADFSADGRYLAISLRSRAEIWDLEVNKGTTIARPFRSLWIIGQDQIFAQLPKFVDQDPQELKLSMAPLSVTKMGKYEDTDRQYRDIQYRFKSDKGGPIYQHATLEVKKMETQTVLWTKDYLHETPACWGAEDGRFVLAWDLASDTAKAEVKNYPALQKEAAAFKSAKKGLLIETVALETGAPLQQVVIPEADLTQGHNDARHAWISGNYILVRGEHDNIVIYTLDTGTKVGEFFGFTLATDAAAGLIAAGNREGEVILLDEHTGKELQRFMLGSAVRTARIVNDKKLLVLTADQIVHRLPLPKQDADSQSIGTAPTAK